ncbi:MAG: hypothetical protein AB8D78_11550 [Akkermansiaceae bacterium]
MKPLFKKLPFVILAYPRTGSYLLVDLLKQFGDIVCYGEIFKKGMHELPPDIRQNVGMPVEKRDLTPLAFLSKVVQQEPEKLSGFKIFPRHNARVFDWAVSNANVKKLALIRSPFEVYVSLLRAEATGSWIDKGNGKKSLETPLRFNPEKFEKEIKYVNGHNSRLKRLASKQPKSVKIVEYDELQDPEKIRTFAKFVGSKDFSTEVEYRLKKQTTETYSELFENFEELLEYVSRTHPEMNIPEDRI